MKLREIQKSDLVWLFDEVWPMMEHAASHRDSCIASLSAINSVLRKFVQDPDTAYASLQGITGIGPVIASGILFASRPDKCVPFDKWTLGWAYELQLVTTDKLRGRYKTSSKAVRKHAKKKGMSILDFVREASDEEPFPIPPR